MIDKKELERSCQQAEMAAKFHNESVATGSPSVRGMVQISPAELRELLAENATLTQECKALQARVQELEDQLNIKTAIADGLQTLASLYLPETPRHD